MFAPAAYSSTARLWRSARSARSTVVVGDCIVPSECGEGVGRRLAGHTREARVPPSGQRRDGNGQVAGRVAGQVSTHSLTTGNGSTKPVAPALVGLVRSSAVIERTRSGGVDP